MAKEDKRSEGAEKAPERPKKEAKPLQQSPGAKWIAAYRYGLWDI